MTLRIKVFGYLFSAQMMLILTILCHNAKCDYSDVRILSIIILIVIIVSVIMLTVVTQSVVAPK
jgi:hypothetical protein